SRSEFPRTWPSPAASSCPWRRCSRSTCRAALTSSATVLQRPISSSHIRSIGRIWSSCSVHAPICAPTWNACMLGRALPSGSPRPSARCGPPRRPRGHSMSKLRVQSFSVSLDGYGAGPRQSLTTPMGEGGMGLHEWVFATRTGRQMFGQDGGETGVDDDFVARGFENLGAWILGRNMLGPVRGPWADESWRGWWGENPPYHTPVFVLTNHARRPLEMAGGTTFHFVTDG